METRLPMPNALSNPVDQAPAVGAANGAVTNPSSAVVTDFQHLLIDNLYYAQGAAVASATAYDYYMALSQTVRRKLLERWRATTQAHYAANPKFVYYLSAEYLMGKQLAQNLLYTDLTEAAQTALADSNLTLADCLEQDPEPGLGNGGLGRLASCFLDSLSTFDIPAMGYGIRYEYGIFRQSFEDGWQVERPDEWALRDYPWEISHSDNMVEVKFYGHTVAFTDDHGHFRVNWVAGQTVRGEPYHLLVPGYGTNTVNMLRLWRARASRRFNFQVFDTGDYARAVEEKALSESISKVLYPNDGTPQGRELRLKQQYFFVACSLHDIIRRFHLRNTDWAEFANKVVIQLNDTHPVIAIPELMRLLLDEYGLNWDEAWQTTRNSFAYTCHTLMPEALEKWPVELFGRLLPRHLEIVYEINRRFLDEVRTRFPGDEARVRRMSIIDEHDGRAVCMAHLAAVGCFAVNGVAALHSQLLQEHTLRDFAELWPRKFQNKTNGITPRRFIKLANPGLATLISSKLGNGWLTDLDRLRELEAYVDDAAFCAAWREVKRQNKQRLATYAQQRQNLLLNPDSLFDIMVKRLHEYKRQLLNLFYVITLYHRLKDNPALDLVPRTFVFGAKAAPGYFMAKRIIKLINAVANVVNHDVDVAGRLKVAFLENFNVSAAEIIYPAAELSEQISLAGKEASGTGNMKFTLNGALTIGTLDGANIEIRDLVGAENFFLFGLTVEEVFARKAQGYWPLAYYQTNPELQRVIDSIADGHFSQGDTNLFRPIVDSLLYHDEYMVLADYASYVACQAKVDSVYGNQEQWTRMSILNTARSGFFSSDRAIHQYCQEIWKVTPVPVALG